MVWIGGSPPESCRLRPKRVDYSGVQMQGMILKMDGRLGSALKFLKHIPKYLPSEARPTPTPIPLSSPNKTLCRCTRPTLAPPSPL
jgi:hypothetical protein